MTFEEKVKFLRGLPQFKVIPISEVRAIAFAAKASGPEGPLARGETGEQGSNILLGQTGSTSLFLNRIDIEKITREYPDLKSKF